MIKQGSFGYKIGRKTKLMRVDEDADLLWQICVREIYVLLKHYNGSIEELCNAFKELKKAKHEPTPVAIEKCKPFTQLNGNHLKMSNQLTWRELTQNCQHSYINILETGYFLNNYKKENSGLIFILDFNTNSVRFYNKEMDEKETELETASIEEIANFEDMPTKTLDEIITETKERFETFNNNMERIMIELNKINEIIVKSKESNDYNIQGQIRQLKQSADLEKKTIEMEYRYLYHRLNSLNLIDHD
jgi:hypothetical protein